MHDALGARGKRGAFHADISAAGMDFKRLVVHLLTGLLKNLTQHRAERFREFHMNGGALIERSGALGSLVDDLIRHHDLPRFKFLAKASDRAGSEDVRAAEL